MKNVTTNLTLFLILRLQSWSIHRSFECGNKFASNCNPLLSVCTNLYGLHLGPRPGRRRDLSAKKGAPEGERLKSPLDAIAGPTKRGFEKGLRIELGLSLTVVGAHTLMVAIPTICHAKGKPRTLTRTLF